MKHLLHCVDVIACTHGLAADVGGPKCCDFPCGWGKNLYILFADMRQFVWYRNPSWDEFLIAENFTSKDNVCVAAQVIDGDGKCELHGRGNQQWLYQPPGSSTIRKASGRRSDRCT